MEQPQQIPPVEEKDKVGKESPAQALPALPKNPDAFLLAGVLEAYAALARRNCLRFGQHPERSHFAVDLAVAKDELNSVSLRSASGSSQALVAATNVLEAIRKTLPEGVSTQAVGEKVAAVAFTDGEFAKLAAAVNRALELVAHAGSPAGHDLIAKVFGRGTYLGRPVVEQVTARLASITSRLNEFHRTTVENRRTRTVALTGFVSEPGFNPSMPALARGTGPESGRISINTPLIMRTSKDASDEATDTTILASKLVHEVSHTISEWTLDFIYRSDAVEPWLPPHLSIMNAAHYERLVLHMAKVKGLHLPPMPSNPFAVALYLLQLKIARSFVRSNDLLTDLSARKAVSPLLPAPLNLDAGKAGDALMQSLFGDLHLACSALQAILAGSITLTSSDASPTAIAIRKKDPSTIHVAATLTSPSAIAQEATRQMAESPRSRGVLALPNDVLVSFVTDIARFDRPAVGKVLGEVYKNIDTVPLDLTAAPKYEPVLGMQ